MTTDELAPSEFDNVLRPWAFSGIRDVDVGDEDEVSLGGGFSLMKPAYPLLSARSKTSMNETEFEDGASVSRYLVYRQESVWPFKDHEEIKNIFGGGLMALQVLKPVRTLGFQFFGSHAPSGGFHHELIESGPPMEPGPWALEKAFDEELLKELPSTIAAIQQIIKGSSAEKRNAFILLHLGLEHFHPLIAGLMWVMGLEAIFDSKDRKDFKKKLCECLGPSTMAFPDWSAPQPTYTVDDVAIHLYTLRSKVAHGVDLRKAMHDSTYPVDLLKEHMQPGSPEPVKYALILSEAACYLLCQVLQKEIALVSIGSVAGS